MYTTFAMMGIGVAEIIVFTILISFLFLFCLFMLRPVPTAEDSSDASSNALPTPSIQTELRWKNNNNPLQYWARCYIGGFVATMTAVFGTFVLAATYPEYSTFLEKSCILIELWMTFAWWMFLVRAWQTLRNSGTALTPLQAVGCLIVPFYVLYWLETRYTALGRSLNSYVLENELSVPKISIKKLYFYLVIVFIYLFMSNICNRVPEEILPVSFYMSLLVLLIFVFFANLSCLHSLTLAGTAVARHRLGQEYPEAVQKKQQKRYKRSFGCLVFFVILLGLSLFAYWKMHGYDDIMRQAGMYLNSDGTAGFDVTFETLLANAQNPDDLGAQFLVGVLYATGDAYGLTTEVNLPKAYEILNKPEFRNNYIAQGCLGMYYESVEDYENAVKMYEAATEYDLPLALNNLGNLYLLGTGVPKDQKKAAELYRRAAELEFPAAQCQYGICLVNGLGVEQNVDEGKAWIQKAKDQGDADAIEFFKMEQAEMYITPEGTIIPGVTFETLLANAQNPDDLGAQILVGVLYATGESYGLTTEVNLPKAYEILNKPELRDNFIAQGCLGMYYESVEDYENAVKMYEAAAKYNFPLALNNLGNLYLLGTGVPKDQKKAAELYRRAAELEFPAAQCQYGICLVNGLGVEQNVDEGKAWIQKAKDQGLADAIELLKTE